jgi:hypothetical protein
MLFIIGLQHICAQEYDCGWYGKKTVAERNKLFPFNKAKKVVLVSYPDLYGIIPVEGDTLTEMQEYNAIKKVKFQISNSKNQTIYLIKEEIQLNDGWVNQLSHLLVNYTIKGDRSGGYSTTLCYQPRNSVLFYDENDIIISCYEICFECSRVSMWPNPNGVESNFVASSCPNFLEELKTIFKKNGITYGIE